MRRKHLIAVGAIIAIVLYYCPLNFIEQHKN